MQKKYSQCRPIVYAVFTNAVVLSVLGYGMSGCKMAEFSLKNLEGAFVVALFDMMECFAVYTAYKMTDCSLLQPIRFTRIFISMALSYLVLKEQVLRSGDNGEVVTPGPISNPEVKHFIGEHSYSYE